MKKKRAVEDAAITPAVLDFCVFLGPFFREFAKHFCVGLNTSLGDSFCVWSLKTQFHSVAVIYSFVRYFPKSVRSK